MRLARLNRPTPAATVNELANVKRNAIFSCNKDGSISADSVRVALQSAERSSKAARIYAAIARSYGVNT